MRIFHGDVLRFDMTDLFPEELSQPWNGHEPNIHIIGNLPFNVSTPLIAKWLENIAHQEGPWQHGRVRLTLTFQMEVAERLVAPIGHKQRSRLSILCENWCNAHLKFALPGKVFVPIPKVDVGVVRFIPWKEPKIQLPFKLVDKVVRHVFHFRQKKCKRGLQ